MHQRTQTRSTIYALKAMLGITVASATILVFMGIPLPRFQSIIAGPTNLFPNKAFKNLLDPFAKQNAARIKKTSPGIKGMM